jgi:hypothetical protein
MMASLYDDTQLSTYPLPTSLEHLIFSISDIFDMSLLFYSTSHSLMVRFYDFLTCFRLPTIFTFIWRAMTHNSRRLQWGLYGLPTNIFELAS